MSTSHGRYKILSRLDIRKRVDRAGIVTLVYTGRLQFTAQLYGFDDGVFFAVVPSEIPVPADIEEAATAIGMIVADHPDFPALRRAVTDALVADATLRAPELLAELTSTPTRWIDSDRHDLERRHVRALVAVDAAARCMLNDMKRRALLMRYDLKRAPEPPVPVEVAIVPAPVVEPVAEEAAGAAVVEVVETSSTVVARVAEAVRKAREIELHQRLPGGARRQLAKLPPGVYIIVGDCYEPRRDLAGALTDAQEMSRGKDVVVVDWDGEYPIVVRRYSAPSRIVYRVEAALKRAGSEEAA